MAINWNIGILPQRQITIPENQDSLGGLFSGLVSGAKVGAQMDAKKAAGEPVGLAQRVGGVAQAFLGAPAERRAAADPLFELNQQSAMLQNAERGADVMTKFQQYQNMVDAKGAVTQLGDLVTNIVKNGQALDPAARSSVIQFLGRNPSVLDHPAGQQFLKQLERSQEILKSAQEQGMEQQRIDISRGNLDLRQQEFDNPRATMSQLGKLQAERQAALNSGNQQAVAQYDAAIAKETRASGNPLTVFDPATGNPLVQMGGEGGLTVANQTQAQQALQGAMNTIDAVDRLEPLINERTVGVRAWIEGAVLDKIVGQIPGMEHVVSKERADATYLAAELRSTGVRSLRSDTNIAEPERKMISDLFPDIEDPIDSPERARHVIQQVRKMAAIRAAVGAPRLGKPIPDWALAPLEPDDVVSLNRKGMISKQVADDAIRRKLGLK